MLPSGITEQVDGIYFVVVPSREQLVRLLGSSTKV
jgi:hypothetical protein